MGRFKRAVASARALGASKWEGITPIIEELESRRLLTTINADNSGNSIDVKYVGNNPSNNLVVIMDGVTVATNPTVLSIFGQGGRDQIFIASNVTLGVYVSGGDDGDAITGGGGNDTILGGGGVDVIDGNGGVDSLDGGADNDEITGGAWTDYIDGGTGNDELHGGAGDDYISGGDNDDVLYGDNNDDHLFGGDGADYAYGGWGNDYFGDNADDDVDHIIGELGDDTCGVFDYFDSVDVENSPG